MWIFTETGFVSAVRHWTRPDTLVVRARDRQSLESLAVPADTPIEKTPVADYPYRTEVSEKAFVEWLTASIQSMDYANFKDRVDEVRGDRFAASLMSVWDTMHEVEDEDARKR